MILAREGLVETPVLVARAYREWFAGYDEDPDELLQRTFEEVAGYDEMVLLRDIHFVSHCEHHMAPIVGASAYRLSAARSGCGNLEVGSCR